jgi:hypothetical protein
VVIVEDDEVCVGSNPWVRVYTRVEVAVDVQLPDGVVQVQLGAVAVPSPSGSAAAAAITLQPGKRKSWMPPGSQATIVIRKS